MATYSVTTSMSSDTDANFRLWGASFGLALTALGWVKTADTGQIDWTTVVKPAATNTVQGYEIWRANDAFHSAGKGIYMKLEFGSGGSASAPSIWITVGTGSNGSGTITGTVSTRTQRTPTNSTTLYEHKFSGNTSRFTCCWGFGTGTAAGSLIINIERTRDASGVETDEGFYVVHSITSVPYFQMISYLGGLGANNTYWPTLIPPSGGSSGSIVQIYPLYPSAGIFKNPLIGLLAYVLSVIADGSTPSIGYYGANRSYTPLGARVASGGFPSISGATGSILMLAE